MARVVAIAAEMTPAPVAAIPAALRADFDRIRAEFDTPVDDAAVVRALSLWSVIVGAISSEVFGQYGRDTFSDADALFGLQLRSAIDAAFPTS
jgi:hypothetical protein